MNNKYIRTLNTIFSDPINGNIKWNRIESLFEAVGCRTLEGRKGVMFEKDGIRAYFHRPHPEKEALKYRVKDARKFLTKIGIKP